MRATSILSRPFAGVGLRPYRPAHLRADAAADGGIELRWIRRTRVDGDSWLGSDVPLGEEREAYLLRVQRGGACCGRSTRRAPGTSIRRRSRPRTARRRALVFEVAQVSVRFGPGPFERIEFDG